MDLFLPSLTSECAWCKRKLRSQTDKTQSSTYLMCECGLLFCSIACHKIANKAHGVNCKKAVAQQQPPNIPDTVTEEYLTIDEERLLLSSDTLPDFNMCPICTKVPAAGQLMEHTACASTFCMSCLDILQQQQQCHPPPCPTCRDPLTQTNTCEANMHLRTMHQQLAVRCRYYPSCDAPCTLGALANHEKRCDFAKVTCPLCQSDVERRQYLVHVNDMCPRRAITCTECNQRLLYSSIATHSTECPGQQVPCGHCGVSYRRELLKLHQESRCAHCPDSSWIATIRTELKDLQEERLDPSVDFFQTHVLESGMKLINARNSRLATLPKKECFTESTNDPQFVKDFIALHEKFLDMVNKQFVTCSSFQQALDSAFKILLTRSCENFAEILLSFCDTLLKRCSEKLLDDEIEALLDKVVLLFLHLSDKDIFAKVYCDMLAKRLLEQRSASVEMERTMIDKLKQRCGAQFTGKFEGILDDLQVGADAKIQFDAYCATKERVGADTEIGFDVQLLNTFYWPTLRRHDTLNLPPIMAKSVQVFSDFYKEFHHGTRRLQWIHSQGNAEVHAELGLGKVKYVLQVSPMQAVVLLLFHKVPYSTPPLTYAELKHNTNLPDEALKRILHSLACGKFKLLKKSGDPGKVNVESDTFNCNEMFSNKSKKIRISMPSCVVTNSYQKIDEDRGIAIEVAIIREMKAYRMLYSQELQERVLLYFKKRFNLFQPSIRVIRKSIEALIEREFLERDPENHRILHFLN